MPALFGIDIAGIIAAEMGPGLLACTLRTYAIGNRTPGDLSAGPARTSTATTAARGVLVDYSTRDYDGTIVQLGDRKVLLLAATLSGLEPVNGSEIDIEGATYAVINVTRDPAAASYTCQVRKA